MGEYIDVGIQTSILPYQLFFHQLYLAYLHYLEKKQKMMMMILTPEVVVWCNLF